MWAHAAQIVLVFVAIVTYFYTVRPIHHRDMLQEQLAEQRRDIIVATDELAQLQASIAELTAENSTAADKLRVAQATADEHRRAAQALTKARDELETEVRFLSFALRTPDGRLVRDRADFIATIRHQFVSDVLRIADKRDHFEWAGDRDDNAWRPHENDEIQLWHTHGAHFITEAIRKRLRDPARISALLAPYGNELDRALIGTWITEIQSALNEFAPRLAVSYNPVETNEEYVAAFAAIEADIQERRELIRTNPSTNSLARQAEYHRVRAAEAELSIQRMGRVRELREQYRVLRDERRDEVASRVREFRAYLDAR